MILTTKENVKEKVHRLVEESMEPKVIQMIENEAFDNNDDLEIQRDAKAPTISLIVPALTKCSRSWSSFSSRSSTASRSGSASKASEGSRPQN